MKKFIILKTTTCTLAGDSECWSLAVGCQDFEDVSLDDLRTLRELIDEVIAQER